jgi:murein DD-endopeptidase MepM/ murein hydrolase activator NlpD
VLNNTEKADCSRPYPDWTTSPYVVPYPVGASYDLLTGNCDPGHQGENRYGYDFLMPIGSVVAASRGGEVVFSEERWSDSGRNPSENNGVVIAHGDGTFSFYFHLQQNSVLVDLGDTVIQGQVIARSGASGTGPQHLHFHISLCYPGCGTEPTTFSNTDPNPGGLSRGHYWPALPY